MSCDWWIGDLYIEDIMPDTSWRYRKKDLDLCKFSYVEVVYVRKACVGLCRPWASIFPDHGPCIL